jgi:hypothetical protein
MSSEVVRVERLAPRGVGRGRLSAHPVVRRRRGSPQGVGRANQTVGAVAAGLVGVGRGVAMLIGLRLQSP